VLQKAVATLLADLRPNVRSSIPCLAVMILALTLCAPASARPRKRHSLNGIPVPARFVGVNAGGPLLDTNVNLGQQLGQMVADGVETVRFVFNWAQAQPYANWSQVPADQTGQFANVGGVPTDFAATDEMVGLAAQRGLTVLPLVLYAPGWDAGHNRSGGLEPPARTGPYANYLTALIGRYGPHGSFWATHHPALAIRMWQIWNEENLPAYWPRPFARSYVALLRAAHGAIKRADPGAKVVLGALTNLAWRDFGKVYKMPGAPRLFDVAAINGFTSTPSRVIEFLTLFRRGMNALGAQRVPFFYTELSWPSALGQSRRHFDWDTTQAGQARNIASVLPMLAAARASLELSGFYYYTWMDDGLKGAYDDFDFAGLTHLEPSGAIVAKPGLAAFKRAALRIEDCRAKGRFATSCIGS
jgi:hypothetical protein